MLSIVASTLVIPYKADLALSIIVLLEFSMLPVVWIRLALLALATSSLISSGKPFSSSSTKYPKCLLTSLRAYTGITDSIGSLNVIGIPIDSRLAVSIVLILLIVAIGKRSLFLNNASNSDRSSSVPISSLDIP